jgi:hypothetical protein
MECFYILILEGQKIQKQLISEWFLSPLPGSNQRPTDYKSVALPAELKRLTFNVGQI